MTDRNGVPSMKRENRGAFHGKEQKFALSEIILAKTEKFCNKTCKTRKDGVYSHMENSRGTGGEEAEYGWSFAKNGEELCHCNDPGSGHGAEL